MKSRTKIIIVVASIILVTSIVLVATLVPRRNARTDPLVLTDQGWVRGIKPDDTQYTAYLGIPYAQVDLANPFGPPLPHPGFGDEIFDALDGTMRCAQRGFFPVPYSSTTRDTSQAVDCLTLNIYVPDDVSPDNSVPVLAWIHGGGFYVGSAGDDGVPNLVDQGVIVVMMNYRLGPYGFFCLNTPLAPGNQGLKDQHEALQWIRRNIAAFGGNPLDVTLGGLSAGGASVIYHLYSNNEKLYNKILTQSGVPQAEGLFIDGDDDAALKMANHLGFTTDNTEDALSFLANTPHESVIQAYEELSTLLMPCKERQFNGVQNFIVNDLFTFSNEPKIRDTPMLIGHTDKEIFGPFQFVYGDNYVNNLFHRKLNNHFNFETDAQINVPNIVRNFYIGDEIESETVMSQLETFDSDFMFVHPILRTTTDLLNEGAGPIYNYLFSYVRDNEPPGAGHGSDQHYLFQTSSAADLDEGNDRLMSNRITTLWANFIKYGNPTPQTTELLPVTWQPINFTSRPYLVIDRDMRMDNRVFNDRMAFWDLFYSAYGSLHVLANADLNRN